ncbi:hypothetical protein M758_1G216500 [Ceratodon purpureus]|nr:hypothetical protein M758_1G216500 [Ceratodon purpureus]
MASAAKVAKRIPLIKFPNRRGGETQGAKAVAVSQASVGGDNNQAMSSLKFGGGSSEAMPSGTASSQPPRTKLSEAEIEAILLGGATS